MSSWEKALFRLRGAVCAAEGCDKLARTNCGVYVLRDGRKLDFAGACSSAHMRELADEIIRGIEAWEAEKEDGNVVG